MREEIKVGFPYEFTTSWMGGVNYYRNLFIAMTSLEDGPKLIPCILPIKDEGAIFLRQYGREIKTKTSPFDLMLIYRRILSKVTSIPFNESIYSFRKAAVDVMSHSQLVTSLPTIAWIPDFQHIHLPEMFSKSDLFSRNIGYKHLVYNTDMTIVSSESVKEDFCTLYPEMADKARCLHFVAIPEENIYEICDRIYPEMKEKYHLPERYFYLPNQFWRHKNHGLVFEAVAILRKRNCKIHVVCTGLQTDKRNPEYFEGLETFIRENGIEGQIHFLGLIPQTEVSCLMRNSVTVINPSRFEGWSTSVEECKSLGKPILLSDLPVHREQNPPGGEYFSVDDPEYLADLLQRTWEKIPGGPDLEMERQARDLLPRRIREYGESYRKILLELLERHAP